jgi:hypothetical protein
LEQYLAGPTARESEAFIAEQARSDAADHSALQLYFQAYGPGLDVAAPFLVLVLGGVAAAFLPAWLWLPLWLAVVLPGRIPHSFPFSAFTPAVLSLTPLLSSLDDFNLS